MGAPHGSTIGLHLAPLPESGFSVLRNVHKSIVRTLEASTGLSNSPRKAQHGPLPHSEWQLQGVHTHTSSIQWNINPGAE